ELIHTLFSGSRRSALPDKIHQSLTELFFSLRPEYQNNPEKHIMFSYMIYGSYYAYMENADYNSQYVISVISALTKI
ncbi:MAG TPA: TetR/AcrR family transcriptional regulator, partial [Kandleria vitulina]|nr:TetR/AcrR family transcriptional regulator [Kandleria vitulina]